MVKAILLKPFQLLLNNMIYPVNRFSYFKKWFVPVQIEL